MIRAEIPIGRNQARFERKQKNGDELNCANFATHNGWSSVILHHVCDSSDAAGYAHHDAPKS
jgi:hypothetical protein